MSDSCNPLDGSRHTCKMVMSIAQQGADMIRSYHGGKRSRRSKFSKKKRYRYTKYAYVYKKQHTHKHKNKYRNRK